MDSAGPADAEGIEIAEERRCVWNEGCGNDEADGVFRECNGSRGRVEPARGRYQGNGTGSQKHSRMDVSGGPLHGRGIRRECDHLLSDEIESGLMQDLRDIAKKLRILSPIIVTSFLR